MGRDLPIMLCFPTLSWCLMTFIVHEVLLKCGHCSNMGNAKRWSWVALKLNSVLSIRLVCQDYMWWYMVWQDCTWRENTTDQTNICRKYLLYFTAYVHSLLVENFFFFNCKRGLYVYWRPRLWYQTWSHERRFSAAVSVVQRGTQVHQ